MTAALAAQNETVNNYLSNKPANLAAKSEQQQYADANRACSAGDNAACQQARQLLQTSKDRDALLNAACADRASASCGDAIRTAQHNGNYVVFGSDGQLYVYDNAQPVLTAPARASNPFQDQTAQGVTELAVNLAMGEGVGAGIKGAGFVANRLFGFSGGWIGEGVVADSLGVMGRPNFYVTSNGTAIPATGYRAIGGPAVEEAGTGIVAPRNPTYITFDNITNMPPAAVKDVLQLPRLPSHWGSFDTLQIIGDLKIPTGRFNTTTIPEPITRTFPNWGGGGGTQAITNQPIKLNGFGVLPTGTGK